MSKVTKTPAEIIVECYGPNADIEFHMELVRALSAPVVKADKFDCPAGLELHLAATAEGADCPICGEESDVKAEQLAAGQVPDALTFLQDNKLAASGDWQQGWNDCRSFFAAPVPSTVGQEWQPIETAPKALLPESGCAVSDYVLIAYDLFDGDEVYGKGISVGRLRRGRIGWTWQRP